MEKQRYYRIEDRDGIGEVFYRVTKEGRDKVIKRLEAKGHKYKVTHKYM